LPEETTWAGVEAECIRLAVAEQAVEIIAALQQMGCTPREGVGVLRALRNRKWRVDLAETIQKWAAQRRTAADVIGGARKARGCGSKLRAEVIGAFGSKCRHCGLSGSASRGADGAP
jgi:hypothetical protein